MPSYLYFNFVFYTITGFYFFFIFFIICLILFCIKSLFTYSRLGTLPQLNPVYHVLNFCINFKLFTVFSSYTIYCGVLLFFLYYGVVFIFLYLMGTSLMFKYAYALKLFTQLSNIF